MIYEIGQRFIVGSIEARVVYVNRDKAWVSPIDDLDFGGGNKMFSCATFEVLDQRGRDSRGNKAVPMANQECGAV